MSSGTPLANTMFEVCAGKRYVCVLHQTSHVLYMRVSMRLHVRVSDCCCHLCVHIAMLICMLLKRSTSAAVQHRAGFCLAPFAYLLPDRTHPGSSGCQLRLFSVAGISITAQEHQHSGRAGFKCISATARGSEGNGAKAQYTSQYHQQSPGPRLHCRVQERFQLPVIYGHPHVKWDRFRDQHHCFIDFILASDVS
jgi:hypothetical protein